MTDFRLAFRCRTENFSLEVRADWTATITGIFGPSGCGKSTLLEVLLGHRAPATLAGSAEVAGTELFATEARRFVPAHERGLGWVPQEAALFPHLNVRANVAFARRKGAGIDAERVARLAALCEIDTLLDRKPSALSGGERQRVALARALYAPRPVVLLDEPFASLDLKRRARLLAAVVQHARDDKRNLIYVTHDWREVEAACEHALLLDDGRLLASGVPGTIDPY